MNIQRMFTAATLCLAFAFTTAFAGGTCCDKEKASKASTSCSTSKTVKTVSTESAQTASEECAGKEAKACATKDAKSCSTKEAKAMKASSKSCCATQKTSVKTTDAGTDAKAVKVADEAQASK